MKKVLVLVAEGSEEVETVTVIDLLRRAGAQVTIASVGGDQVLIHGGQKIGIKGDKLVREVKDSKEFEGICLPGGSKAAETFGADERVRELLKEFEGAGKLVGAMCASTMALKAAGVFAGRRVTSWPSFKSELMGVYQYEEQPVVVDGMVVTSRGPGTAMGWALAIVGVLYGEEAKKKLAMGILAAL